MGTTLRRAGAMIVMAAVLLPSAAWAHVAGPLEASVKTRQVRHSGEYAIVRGKIKVTNTATGGITPLVKCTVILKLSDGRRTTHGEAFGVPSGASRKKRFAVSVPDFEGEVTSAKGRVKHCHR